MNLQDYNFVIFGSEWDLYKTSYSDVIGMKNIRYIESIPKQLGRMFPIWRMHCSKTSNKYINLPFKSLWGTSLFKNDFDNDNPIYFICFSGWAKYFLEAGLASHFKSKYNCKIILFLQDIVCIQKSLYKNEGLNIDKAKSVFDLILSFDYSDCDKYGFIYHPLVFSSMILPNKSPQYDIYFLGQAKNRLKEILEIYKKLRDVGLKLNFNILNAKEEERLYDDEINYIHKGLTYKQNLQHIANARCLLEIMQQGGTGYTQRVVEAVGLNKMLLSNNQYLYRAPFYRNKYMSSYSDVNSIDLNFIETIRLTNLIDYQYNSKLSPVELLQFIIKHL